MCDPAVIAYGARLGLLLKILQKASLKSVGWISSHLKLHAFL